VHGTRPQKGNILVLPVK